MSKELKINNGPCLYRNVFNEPVFLDTIEDRLLAAGESLRGLETLVDQMILICGLDHCTSSMMLAVRSIAEYARHLTEERLMPRDDEGSEAGHV